MTPKISVCLWFDDQAEEAVSFYASVFKERQGPGQSPARHGRNAQNDQTRHPDPRTRPHRPLTRDRARVTSPAG